MGALFTILFSKIAAVVEWFGQLFVAVFKAIWFVLTDLLCWGFDKGLGVALSAVSSIDVSGVSGNVSAWGQIPGEVLNILSLLGVGQAVAIISSAIAIRFALQLIPFVRLGS